MICATSRVHNPARDRKDFYNVTHYFYYKYSYFESYIRQEYMYASWFPQQY